jgi:nucleoside-diphosphate kinase
MERTLSIIKPDALQKGVAGKIIDRFETEGLKVVAMRMVHLSRKQAEGFYEVHKERPFFNDLVAFMTMGPIIVMALEGKNAVLKNREIMGATDPAKAQANTLRKHFGTNVEKNAVHGSDSPENAQKEIQFFFEPNQIQKRI